MECLVQSLDVCTERLSRPTYHCIVSSFHANTIVSQTYMHPLTLSEPCDLEGAEGSEGSTQRMSRSVYLPGLLLLLPLLILIPAQPAASTL
jgi:hypothetical protein